MLEIRLLGQFQIRIDGKPVDISSRPEQSLLAYLILNAGTAFRREHLAGLLWPDSDETNAKGYLRQALWRLRKDIHATIPSARDYIRANKISIAFDLDFPYWLDIAVLEDEAGAGLEDLLAATQAYAGELLPGFYDEWVLLERERLRAVFNRKMQRLLEQLRSTRRWRDLIRQAERWISMGDNPEPAYRGLILANAELGDLSGTRTAYDRCAITLERELGVRPSEETQKLFRKFQTNQIGLPTHLLTCQTRTSPQPSPFLGEEPTGGDESGELFIGREIQLARLAEYLKAVQVGQVKLAFVRAETGMGKTSLLDHFSRLAQEEYPHLIIASGGCTTYSETGDPYLPFREILGMLSADIERKWAAGSLSRNHALRLWNLLPSTHEALVTHGQSLLGTFLPVEALLHRAALHELIHPDLIARLQDLISHRQGACFNQGRIFEEYTRVLMQISRKSPLLLILDDLHWADASSINLLFHLGKRLTRAPILILGAYRPEEINLSRQGEGHPLVSVLDEFKRLFGDIWLDLEHASNEEGRRFVDALIDREPNRLSEGFRTQLARSTRSHPLFTVETLREMKERGDLAQDRAGRWIESPGIDWDTLPKRVEGVIAKRVNRLDPWQKEALVTASVEGEDFTAEVIAQVHKIDEGTVIRMLSGDLEKGHNLVRACWVERSGDKGISHYQFSHNLFQKYLYSTLDPVERVFQHEAVGNALERLYRGRTETIAVQLVRHFQEAGAIEKAIQYWKQAGEPAGDAITGVSDAGRVLTLVELNNR